MKAHFIVLFLLSSIASYTNASTGELKTFFYYAPFYSPQTGSYLETYLTVIGNSAVFIKNANSKFQASIEVTLIFKQEGNIVNFKKYNLLSPEVDDTSKSKPNFIDQQRILLKDGYYNFELKITDINNSTGKSYTHNDIITLNFPPGEVSFSGIQFIESYKISGQQNILTKNGYDLVPYVSDFFPDNINKLTFYAEMYNSDTVFQEKGDFLLSYYIESTNGKILNEYSTFKKQKACKVAVILNEFTIDKLPSGNYNLVIEARDRTNRLIKSKKMFFQRSNPQTDKNVTDISKVNTEGTFVGAIINPDTLIDNIASLRPISDSHETVMADNFLATKNVQNMQQYIYRFWSQRNSEDPEGAWKKYREQVNYVNKAFGTQIKKGYETDRGRVYLQYGPPNKRVDSKHEPSAYPYEIWQYYKMGEQSNRKFVFYNPDLVGEEYSLLHSDAKGENSTPNWEMVLNKRNNPAYNFDQKESPSHYGGNALDNYKNPK